jgi:hypothetical protein
MNIDLEEIRTRHGRITKGMWYWSGHLSTKEVNLMSSARGRPVVMAFRLWGRNGQPVFRDHQRGTLESTCDLAKTDGNVIIGIDNPDAIFIEHAPSDVQALLIEVDRLRAELDLLRSKVNP